ncbi:osmoprotectant transport system ATP-binding protein [Alkalihalobacillus xiaoxiensis]|uniref:Osmoprotectant transport system ATP-binding protein n=1 Tax=Shouchella xiaoxiensis TaxID=766895 RepID=A0ABS2SZP8_9BACI|nr:ATP-binding cassette domain-containing protein [Shouchella xiaoxiensis]MBM7840255.1 osmoprotectant transport system ATP-binding protein [Shouchella xiaoxiensis]
MITFQQVDKSFSEDTKAVKELSFTIERGEFFVLIGPSGCGKTTTLKMINRLIDPSNGAITINGSNHREVNLHELRWNIGYVLQQIALFPHMTVAENIAVVPEMKKWKQGDIAKRVDDLLELVGMEPATYRDRLPADLSGGQQQRVGVARALAGDPDIILMDEPFSALDPLVREQLQNDIKELQQKIKKTIVFVTHDMSEATKLGDRIGMMEGGKLLQIGTAEELYQNPASSAVSDFIGRSTGLQEPQLKDAIVPLDQSQYVVDQVNEQSLHLQFVIDNHKQLVTTYFHGQQLANLLIVQRTSSLKDAFEAMEQQQLPAVLVKDNDTLIGVISYKDLARLTVH